jgi:nucleotide-binding universal stress UspA family protein
MFENVVVGVDGQAGGRDAIRLAAQLSSRRILTLAHIYCESQPLPSDTEPLHVQAEKARTVLARERDACFPGANVVTGFAASVGRGLHEAAARQRADLLVIGSSHRGPVGRVLLKDDTRAALNGAPCAIAVAPRGYADQEGHELRSIGVGFDGSSESELALAAARTLASRTGDSVHALWVVSLDDVCVRAAVPADWPEQTDALVYEVQDRLDRIDGINGQAMYGGPKEELVKLGARSDLLIVGSRGYGPLGSLFHGSVSTYLERRVDCPLLVLPRTMADESRSFAEPRGERIDRLVST